MLVALIGLLQKVVSKESINKMGPPNLAIVFAPSIAAASAAVVGEEEFHSRLRRGTMRLGRVPVELVVVFALIDSPYREQNVVGEAQRRA
jgi:hypothetical protein